MVRQAEIFFIVCVAMVSFLLIPSRGWGDEPFTLASPAFQNKGQIPRRYTCEAKDINPPLKISGIPAGTKSLALIVDDPDAPLGTWVHWVVYNIPAAGSTLEIAENSVPGLQLGNDFGKRNYGGPCPPSRTHRYFFKLYALDASLTLPAKAKKRDLEKAMVSHTIARAQLLGLYQKGW